MKTINDLLERYHQISTKIKNLNSERLKNDIFEPCDEEADLIKEIKCLQVEIDNYERKDDFKLSHKIIDQEKLNYELAKKRKKEIIKKYGGGKALSKILKVSHPAISKWEVIPPLRAFEIQLLGDFTLEYIRPDLKFMKK